MPTQLQSAKAGKITEEMAHVAREEELTPEEVRELVASGQLVIPKNVNHHFAPRAIGARTRTKVNANLGISSDHGKLEEELEKLRVAIEYGSDSVMDLSSGYQDLDHIRESVIKNSSVMVGTVPIYGAMSDNILKGGSFADFSARRLLNEIEKQGEQGVDYITVHCGITRQTLKYVDGRQRIVGIVSKGGSVHAAWMRATGKENPLYEFFDELCEIAARYDMTFSLGDSLRPGGTGDATDAAQIQELLILGELTKRAWDKGVQVMIEGPGHVPINQIAANVLLQKKLCHGAPFYVLGPLTIDTGAGYDHITGAIGGAVASAAGADMLCYVTPAEHLRLPDADDVRQGVIATRIAAQSGDLGKGIPYAKRINDKMSAARKKLDWETMFACAIDPKEARRFRQTSEDYDSDVCTMCGDLCAVRMDNFTDLGKGRAPADLRAMPMSKDREDLRRKKATIAAKKAQEGYFDDNGVWVAPEASGATAPSRAPRGERVLRDKK
ncbi:MAG: phosphomethylpyrimidine synthase ThiC [Planctomycetaceae bacterium]|nr:phosphomethylpyrimidine synthase ThiC [Planctomycetaceae bacterium]